MLKLENILSLVKIDRIMQNTWEEIRGAWGLLTPCPGHSMMFVYAFSLILPRVVRQLLIRHDLGVLEALWQAREEWRNSLPAYATSLKFYF